MAYKKINILYIIPHLQIGGTERHLSLISTSLGRDKFGLKVCCLRNSGQLVEKITKAGIQVINLNLSRTYDLRILFKLFWLMRQYKIDIVHTYLFNANIIGSIAAKLARIPVIISSRRDLDFWQKRRHIWAEKFANRLVDKIVACSDAVKNFQIHQEGIEPEKVITIYNGIDLTNFSVNVEDNEKRKQFNIRSDKYILGMVANFSPEKDHRTFLKAAKIIKRKVPKIKFLLVGDGPLRKEIIDFAKRLNIEDDVIFTGLRNDIPEILSLFNVFVLSSIAEGFPNVILEAMAMAKPVVATNVGGIPEVVVNRETGILVPVRNPRAISEAIVSLLRDSQRAKRMGQAGRRRVEAVFNLKKMTECYDKLYEEMAKGIAR